MSDVEDDGTAGPGHSRSSSAADALADEAAEQGVSVHLRDLKELEAKVRKYESSESEKVNDLERQKMLLSRENEQLRAIIQHHAPHALPPRLGYSNAPPPQPAPSYNPPPRLRTYAPPAQPSSSYAGAPGPIAPRRATLPPPIAQPHAARFAPIDSFERSERPEFDASHRFDSLSRPLTTASGTQLGTQPSSWLAHALPPASAPSNDYAYSPTLPPLTDGRRYEARAQPLPSYSSLPMATAQYGWPPAPIAPANPMPSPDERWAYRPAPPPSDDPRYSSSAGRGGGGAPY